MRLSATLSFYLSRQLLFWTVVIFGGLTAVLLMFDLVEQLRRVAGRVDVGYGIAVQLALLQLPHLIQQTLPFTILFGAMMAFWRLSRSNELAVARAAGVSAWQFLLPGLLIAALIGVFQITAFNPLAATLLARFEHLDAIYLKHSTSRLAVSPTGLWLRQGDDTGQTVINAQRSAADGTELLTVTFFVFKNPDHFIRRIDADRAWLGDGYWNIERAWIAAPSEERRFAETYRIPTDLTPDKIQDSFASPETMSFWAIPCFLQTLEAAGFSGHRHRMYWHTLLATPLLLAAMILFAAVFTLKAGGRTGATRTVSLGVLCSFALYFASDIVHALGLSASIPAVLAAWSPPAIATLLALAMVFHLEDG